MCISENTANVTPTGFEEIHMKMSQSNTGDNEWDTHVLINQPMPREIQSNTLGRENPDVAYYSEDGKLPSTN